MGHGEPPLSYPMAVPADLNARNLNEFNGWAPLAPMPPHFPPAMFHPQAVPPPNFLPTSSCYVDTNRNIVSANSFELDSNPKTPISTPSILDQRSTDSPSLQHLINANQTSYSDILAEFHNGDAEEKPSEDESIDQSLALRLSFSNV